MEIIVSNLVVVLVTLLVRYLVVEYIDRRRYRKLSEVNDIPPTRRFFDKGCKTPRKFFGMSVCINKRCEKGVDNVKKSA